MASNTSLITQITGQAWIRGADGALTPLQAGMSIPANADVVTSTGASVQLQVDGQPPLIIGESRDVHLGADVAQPNVDPLTSAAAVLAEPDTAGILTALEAGADPFAELDPTAAVIQGGGPGDGGSSFTRLAAVLELTTPLGLEYPRPTYPRTEEIRLGGVGSNRAPELTGSALTAAGLLDQINDDSDIITGLNVGQYFTDPDGHDLTFTATGLPPGLTINPNTGVIEGKLDSSASQGGPGGNGIYNVVITGTDPYGSSVQLPFTWTTNNPPPVAEDDVNTTEENTVVVGNVLTGDADGKGADVDPDGDKLTVTEVISGDKTFPAGVPIPGVNPIEGKGGGTFTINPDGSYKFDPGTDFDYLAEGEEATIEVTYKIVDADGADDEATLTITITGTNDAPVAKEDAGTVTESGVGVENDPNGEVKGVLEANGNVLDNDSDVDTPHDELSVESVTLNGTKYEFDDGATSLSIEGIYGDLVIHKNGDYSYTLRDSAENVQALKPNETKTEVFTYVVSDGQKNDSTATQDLTITIVGTNDKPVIVEEATTATGAVTEAQNTIPDQPTTAEGQLTAKDVDNTHDELSWSLRDGETLVQGLTGDYGTIKLDKATGKWIYELDDKNPKTQALKQDESKTEVFIARVQDEHGAWVEQTIEVTVTGTNDKPIVDDTTTKAKGTVIEAGYQEPGQSTAEGKLVATDVEGDTLAWSFDEDSEVTELKGTYGTITLDPVTGEWKYTLRDDWDVTNELNVRPQNPVEEFTAYVSDGKGGVTEQKITVTVQGTNDAPEANPDSNSVVESGVAKGEGTDPNAKVDGKLKASGNVLTGEVEDEINEDFSDTDVDSDPKDFTIGSVTFDGVTKVMIDGGSVEFTGEYGDLTIFSNGDYTYTLRDGDANVQALRPDESAEEVFTYVVKDDHGAPSEANLTIRVEGTNDRPEITTKNNIGEVKEAGHHSDGLENPGKPDASGTLQATDVDAKTYELSWSIQKSDDTSVNKLEGKYGTLKLNQKTGEWEYKLDNTKDATQQLKEGEEVKEEFNVRVTDGLGAYDDQKIIINVEGTNDKPKAKDDVVEFKEDLPNPDDSSQKSSTGNVLDNDRDPDHGENTNTLKVTTFEIDGIVHKAGTIVEIGGPANVIGSFVLKSDGSYVFTPQEHYSGKVPEITYTIQDTNDGDDDGMKDTAKLKFEITPVADVPGLDDNKELTIQEDETTAKPGQPTALDLKVPTVTDSMDWNGPGVAGEADNGDNPERLGLITLTIKGEGFAIDNPGKLTYPAHGDRSAGEIDLTTNGQKVLIFIIDGDHEHIHGAIEKAEADGFVVVQMTPEQYEAMELTPPAHTHNNIEIKVDVSSYEVDADGKPLPNVAEAPAESQVIKVDVLAVTDDVLLTIDPAIEVGKPLILDAKGPSVLPDAPTAGVTVDSVTIEEVNGVKTPVLGISGSIKEDTQLNLKGVLQAAFDDLDGSEERWITITNTTGGEIVVNGVTLGKGDAITIGKDDHNLLGKSEKAFGDIWVSNPEDASGKGDDGGLKGKLEITLHAQDRDGDNKDHEADLKESTVRIDLDLDVTPVVDGLQFGSPETEEDTGVKFLAGLAQKDTDGSEKVTSLKIKLSSLPEGAVIKDSDGNVIVQNKGGVLQDAQGKPLANQNYLELLPGGELTDDVLSALQGYELVPPAHSSKDFELEFSYDVTDNANDLASDVKTNVSGTLPVTVTPKAEKIPEADKDNPDADVWDDTDGDGIADLTMTKGHIYDQAVSPGTEDVWFNLNVQGKGEDKGFNLKDGWSNQDGKPAGSDEEPTEDNGTEETFAVLTPKLEGLAGESATGAQFRYKDPSQKTEDNPEGYVIKTFNGKDGVEIPMEFLDTLEFLPPPHVSGTFNIKVEAKTVDSDFDDPTLQDSVTSGEAWLNGIVVAPVADEVTLAVGGAHGKEDSDIPLHIRPTSEDPSETFNVEISGIPEGAVLTYDGNPVTDLVKKDDGTYTATINGFESDKGLTVKPPHNSNEDFVLEVKAQSVDTLGNVTSTGVFSESQKIAVQVDGLADKATVEFAKDVSYTEADIDAGNREISLSDIIIDTVMHDKKDGSETLSYKISGMPDGFTVEGATYLGDKEDPLDREWTFTQEQLDAGDVVIKVPPHYSGKLPGQLSAITTENDGDSRTTVQDRWDIDITPSPEHEMVIGTDVTEDRLTNMEFKVDIPDGGDTNETLTELRISVDSVDQKGFTLYLGEDGKLTLKDAAKNPDSGVTRVDDYYILKGGSITNVYVKPDSNYSGKIDLDVQYKITNDVEDGSDVSSVSEWHSGTHTVNVTPVTDEVQLTLNDPVSTVTGTGSGKVSVDITLAKKGIAGEGDNPDHDGSEQFTQVFIEGVPNGMLVEGLKVGDTTFDNVSYLGDGKWLISIPNDEYPTFTGDGIKGEVQFKVTGNVANKGNNSIKITVDTQDDGNQQIKSDTEGWDFSTSGFGGGAGDKSSVTVDWTRKDFDGIEDTIFTLGDAFNGTIVQKDSDGEDVDVADANFSIVLTLSPGSTVIGPDGKEASSSIIKDENGEDLEVWVFTGKGQDQLDDYLNNIKVTPPGNLNDNADDKFKFEVDFTGYLDNGKQSHVEFGKDEDAYFPLTPVTDSAVIDITFSAAGSNPASKPQEGSDVAINLNITSPDGEHTTFIDNTVRLKLTEGEDFKGGALSIKNPDGTLTPLTPDEDGLYVVPLPDSAKAPLSLDLVYKAADGKEYTNGTIKVEAWVDTQERDAENVKPSIEGVGEIELEGINNGYVLIVGGKSDGVITGDENHTGKGMIPLDIDGSGLVDDDGSEQALSAMLKNLPNGFLVYYRDGENGPLVLASNAGEDAAGNNTWLLPMDGNKLPEIFVQPPKNWSGTAEDLELSVLSGEKGKETWGDAKEFDLVVNPVVDGLLSFKPNPAFGKEGEIIQLNLNIVMKDDQKAGDTDEFVEKVILTLEGLGEHVAFYIGDKLWKGSVKYNDGVYTLSGLTQDQLNNLGFIQASGAAGSTIKVSVQTVETNVEDSSKIGSESAKVENEFTLDISNQLATSDDDTLLYGGGLLDGGEGNDTVWLRFGEDLDFSDSSTADSLRNIEILDLTKGFVNKAGEETNHDHKVLALGTDDVFNITDDRNILTIKADQQDEISLKDGEWILNADKSNDDYDVYIGKNSAGKDVEVHITKDTEVGGLLLEDTGTQSIDSLLDDAGVATASVDGSTGAASAGIEMDHGQHNQLINDLIQQGKLATDTQ